jgi:RNA polymerase sigma factor (sigma-70 family)
MTQCSEAERFLLERVRQHDGDAWSQLVARYEGRLLAFARARGATAADAEDLVQDVFLLLLRGLAAFRGEASLETYLFLLLRRRLIDQARTRRPVSPLGGPDFGPPAAGATPSAYARGAEELDRNRAALAAAIANMAGEFQRESNLRDLRVAEMLFYGQMRNGPIARATGLTEAHVALLKHRWIKRLRADVIASGGEWAQDDESAATSLLSDVWEDFRPTCPKRTTLGGYLLQTLDPPWQEYVAFHVDALGCKFCRANLEDLRRETASEDQRLRQRIVESSVGFFRRS